MQTRTLTINAPSGLHARPAGELVKLVKGFPDSKVSLSTVAKTINAASMLSVLSLGLKSGSQVVLTVEGGDESAVLAVVGDFIESISE